MVFALGDWPCHRLGSKRWSIVGIIVRGEGKLVKKEYNVSFVECLLVYGGAFIVSLSICTLLCTPYQVIRSRVP